jgi:hypothetical protein
MPSRISSLGFVNAFMAVGPNNAYISLKNTKMRAFINDALSLFKCSNLYSPFSLYEKITPHPKGRGF